MSANKTALLEEPGMRSVASKGEDWLVAAEHLPRRSHRDEGVPEPPGIRVGRLVGVDASGLPLVEFSGKRESGPILARHTCAISKADIGREAVLVFENGDLSRPIVLGLLQVIPAENSGIKSQPIDVILDGRQVTLTAENEIVLRCGKASITLTRAGKVLINGEYLLSRSNGVNRIKGGSVQIN